MSDVTRLDKKGTLEAIYRLAIASEMYSGVDHIIKYISQNNLAYTSIMVNCI
jgi:hypothetical protein